MKELVSVVITTYKRRFCDIERSIISVENQTYPDIEIILVDDNNQESVYRQSISNEIKKYPDIRYIKKKSNSGAQRARNTGIKYAKGVYIAFLDDDDEWLPEKIEKQVKCFSDLRVGLVYCKGYSVIEPSKTYSDYITSKNFKSEVGLNDLLYADYIGTTTQAVVRKSVFYDIGGFDVKQPARQDYEMWLRISRKYKCVGVETPLFVHYVHEGEQISKNIDKGIIGLINIINKYKFEYEKSPVALSHISFLVGQKLCKGKKYMLGMKYVSKGLINLFLALFIEPHMMYMRIVEHYKKN